MMLATSSLYPSLLYQAGASPLSQIRSRALNLTLYGVVSTFKPPSRARGGGRECYVTLVLVDPSTPDEGTTMMVFKPTEEELPNVQNVGDIVRGTLLKVTEWGSKMQIQSTKGSDVRCVNDDTGDPVVEYLRQWSREKFGVPAMASPRYQVRGVMNRIASPSIPSSMGRPTWKAEEMVTPNFFFDFVGMVVDVFSTNDISTTVYFTDYTWNDQLLAAEPFPKRDDLYLDESAVLPITFWDEKAAHASNLVPGTFVYVRNARTKPSSVPGYLEIHVHGDPKNNGRNKIAVLPSDDPSVQDIIRKQRDRLREKQPTRMILPVTQTPVTLSQVKLSEPPAKWFVRNVRVVACTPPKIHHFSRIVSPCCESSVPTNQRGEYACETCRKPFSENQGSGYRWMFALYLKDSTAFLPVIVSDEYATEFLGFRPTNLFQDSHALSMLVRALSGLWSVRKRGFDHSDPLVSSPGALIERARDFDVCLESYVVEAEAGNREGVAGEEVRYKVFNCGIN
ncbi:hypothetical protein BJ742DRAFT_831395 [Cladochytrium replicatum]|nr:hypothetical protein BJ742DRAFT_831395 [Cladochytrium replicatum]